MVNLTVAHEATRFEGEFSNLFHGCSSMGDLLLSPLTDCLNVKQAAEFLGVTPKTLRNWDRAGKLKPLRHPINDYRLYPIDELKRLSAKALKSRRGRPRSNKTQ
jgi:MerR family copper efflux transcriptional regulator